jgi:putative ABC transport system permease protein
MMRGLIQDLRHAIRTFLKKPGFTFVAVLTLALGIGASATIFSVVNGVLLRPLPYPEPGRLVHLASWSAAKGTQDMDFTDPLFAFYRDRNHSFESLAVYDSTGFNFTDKGEPERLTGATVTHDFFRVLGREPIYGRSFLPQEDTPGNNNVTVLSHEFWQRRFGGDPLVVGRSINLNNVPTIIVGIMPGGFDFPRRTDLWVPVGLNPQSVNLSWHLNPIGRLKPGVTMANANQEVAALWDDYAREMKWPKAGPDAPRLIVIPLADRIVGEVRTPLLVLLAAVGLVLLIACANIANLLLARGTTRRREIAVRCCLGASSWRIVRQLLTESLLVAAVGGGAGLLLAFWGVQAIKRLPAGAVPRVDQVQVDPRMMFFTFSVAILTGLLFGLAPALQAARINVNEAMKEGARGSAPPSTRRLSNTFVIAQIALSLVLLVGAALLLQSFKNLLAVDLGFRPANVLTARLELPANRYPDDASARRFYEPLLERVQNTPGVMSAGLCQWLPLSGRNYGNNFTVDGLEPRADQPLPIAWFRDVTPGYFETMGIPLLSGETFHNTDTEKTPRVAIVTDNLARKYWPGQNPIGKHIRIGRAAWGTPLMTVVGVVAPVKSNTLDEDPLFYVYRPFAQNADSEVNVVIRTNSDPQAIVSALRNEVAALDAGLPVFDVHTMDQAVAESLSTRRLTNLLLTGFAFSAFVLAVLGIYGVMSLNVNNRINEFGIRLALGARPGSVLRLVIGQGVKLALIGTVVGLAGALWLTRFIEKLLFGVKATDPLTFIMVAVALVITALVACYIPARRATKVDPLVALRYE